MKFPTIDNQELLLRAIEIYGKNAQVDMAIEEMAELTKALCKERRGQGVEAVAEEMGDVLIMYHQLLSIFDNADKVEEYIMKKTARLSIKLQNTTKS